MTLAATLGFNPDPVMEDEENVITEFTENDELERRFYIHQKLSKVGNDLVKHLVGGTFRGYDVFSRRRKLREAVQRTIRNPLVRELIVQEIQDLGYPGMAAIAAAGGYNAEILSALYSGNKDVSNKVVLALRRLATGFGLLYSPMLDFTPVNVEAWIRGIAPETIVKIVMDDDTAHDLWLLCKWAAEGRSWLWNQITFGNLLIAVQVEIHAGNMKPVEVLPHHHQLVAV